MSPVIVGGVSASPAEVGRIVYTIFPDTSARKKYELAEGWAQIVASIKAPRVAAEKSALPLISMGVYGDERTSKNALRHEGNLRAITGVEGDYDGKLVPLEDAAERIGLAGIKAVFYTTPSHEPDAPKWRILAPLSREYPPSERARFLARINGILGGILAGESFTLSQSFYIGRVEGREYQVIDLDGDCIDLRDEFDATAIMPKGKSTADGGRTDETTDDEHRAAIRTGKDFHGALRALSSRLIGRGMPPADAEAVLVGLMQESSERGTERWRQRLAEIPRLIESAASKFRDPRREGDAQGPPDDQFPPIDVIADGGGQHAVQDVALIAFDLGELLQPVPPERDLIAGMIPTEAYTVLAGALSAAKTTFLHLMVLSRASGFDLLQLEAHIEVGPCVLVSYEDSDARIRRRLLTCIQWGHAEVLRAHGPRAAQQFLALVVQNVRRLTLTGQRGSALVCRDLNGNAAPNTGQIDAMLTGIKQFAARELLIGIDPLRLAFRGSQNDDDGADVTVETLNMLACAFPDSALVVPTHTTKSGAVEPGTDRATQAYATSGSALYSQHARSNFHLARPKPDEARRLVHPEHVTEEEITGQRITVLSHARLSHGAERKPLLYAMRKGVLVPIPSADGAETTMQALRRALPMVAEAITRICTEGGRASAVMLEDDNELRRKWGRNDLRRILKQLHEQGWTAAEGATTDRRVVLTDAGRSQLSPPGRSSPASDAA